MKVGVQVLGVEELAKAMFSMDREVRRKAMRAALYEGAKVYAGEAKRRCPVRKHCRSGGNLMMSIEARPVTVDWDNPFAGVMIKPSGWYWHFVEFGTRAYEYQERRYTTGVAGGVAGQSRGRVGKSSLPGGGHAATPAQPFIRPTIDSFYVRHEYERRAREVLSIRVAAWQRKQARAARRVRVRGAA